MVALPTERDDESEYLTARLGKKFMVPPSEVITSTEAQDKHLRAFEQGCDEWSSYHIAHPLLQKEKDQLNSIVVDLLAGGPYSDESFVKALKAIEQKNGSSRPKKNLLGHTYFNLVESGDVQRNTNFERIITRNAVRSNSGVVVITVVTAPGRFSCPNNCHYCPDEPGQPRSYLSTEPAVQRANQNDFDPVRQFYDRANSLAKQGHTVDKIEIIVLGGTWSHYPRDYQEEFCRDLFYAANTFDEHKCRLGSRDVGKVRVRRTLLEEQNLNESATAKIIGLTLETRPDHINIAEVRRLRKYGCTRVQIGVQHTDDEVLRGVNRGHGRAAAVDAVRLLKTCGFKVDIHLMPDLPGSDPDKDWEMFQDVLHGDELQVDHWKIYPCEVTPFTKIETWYREGSYKPYADTDPRMLADLLARVKAEVHPWIRLNRVIRDIPEVSIVGGNTNVNLRQLIFSILKERGQSCRCIRCREVRDWPETIGGLRLRVREYRSSGGTEYFISVEGGDRGLGGGATQRALAGGEKFTKKERMKEEQPITKEEKLAIAAAVVGETREERKANANAALVALRKERAANKPVEVVPNADLENATLYGLLRLRFNDNPHAPGTAFPELDGCALIRELHVYGQLVAARCGESQKAKDDDRPQHVGIGRVLMGTAELIAAAHGWTRISVIAGVGVRNYYRRLGYTLCGNGQYLVKKLAPCSSSEKGKPALSFEAPLATAAARIPSSSKWSKSSTSSVWKMSLVTLALAGLMIGLINRRR